MHLKISPWWSNSQTDLKFWALPSSRGAVRSRRGGAPEGSPAFRPGVEARSADDPGKRLIIINRYDPARVSHSPGKLDSATPGGVEGNFLRRSIPGSSSGLAPLLDTWAKHRAPLPGCLAACRSRRCINSSGDHHYEHPCRGASQPADPAGALIPLAITITSDPGGVQRCLTIPFAHPPRFDSSAEGGEVGDDIERGHRSGLTTRPATSVYLLNGSLGETYLTR